MIKTDWEREQLHGKTVWAVFMTPNGESYEGQGRITASGRNPAGKMSIHLLFRHPADALSGNEYWFQLSERQAKQIRPAVDHKDADYEYQGPLKEESDVCV